MQQHLAPSTYSRVLRYDDILKCAGVRGREGEGREIWRDKIGRKEERDIESQDWEREKRERQEKGERKREDRSKER